MTATSNRPETSPARRPWATRADLVTVAVAVALVSAAVAVGAYHNRDGSQVRLRAPAAPLYGDWDPRAGVATVFAVLLAIAVVMYGPALAARLRWRRLLAAGYTGAVGWTFALALLDGWDRGLARRLDTRFEYLAEVPGITDIPAMIDGFADRILKGSDGTWNVHVAGHPPGATLVFVWLDRIGLSGGSAAAVTCVLLGGLIAVAVPVTVRALGDAGSARAVVPFAVLFPGAIWVGASADGLFAGVSATGIALLAMATRASGVRMAALASAAGVVLGFGVFLSYGFVLFGPLALAVVAYRRAWPVLPFSIGGALAVVGVFALAGFWWLDGYHNVVERYYQGVGAARPYGYWVWANLAALLLLVGLAVAAGVRRVVAEAFRGRAGAVTVLVAGGLVAILVADLSGLSKAETERIWLPFAVWLLPAVALLPGPGRRQWLAVQAAGALVVTHLVWTWW